MTTTDGPERWDMVPAEADPLTKAEGCIAHFERAMDGKQVSADTLLDLARVYALIKIARELEHMGSLMRMG